MRRTVAMMFLFACLQGACGEGQKDAGDWTTEFRGSTPWNLAAEQPGGRTVTLIYLTWVEAAYDRPAQDVRDRLLRVDVAETDDMVRIGLDQVIQYRKGRRIASQSIPVAVSIRLSRPIGSRQLVHAPTIKSVLSVDPHRAYDAMAQVRGEGDGVSDPALWGSS